MLVADEVTFAERLKTLREAAGLNQAALAKASGVSFQAISKFERGEREPSWGVVRKLARALKVSIAAFDTDDSGTPPAEPGDAQPDGPEVAPEQQVPRGKFK